MRQSTATRYWEKLGVAQRAQGHQRLWRAHSDAVNVAWLASSQSAPTGRWLKTDLFDEALADGLFPWLSAGAAHVFAVDLSAATARAATTRYVRLHGTQADVRSLPFADAVFDGIVSTSTLDHFTSLGDIAASLAELYRVLRPGGRLFLTLDNLANPVVRLRNGLPFGLLNGLGIVPYKVGATCGPQTLRKMVEDAGFELVDHDAIMHCPRVFAVAVARLFEGLGSPAMQRRFLQWLLPFERLARMRTRFITGYFIAVHARRP